jgi:phytoene synthase
MKPEIAASYRCAEAVARGRARNFYYAFVALPAEKRRALCAVYAFMRYCDDISDGPCSTADKRCMLQTWRSHLAAALQGRFEGSPVLPAFHDTVQRFSIPAEYFHWVIDGAEMDLTVERYRSFADLYQYCFKVASAVGLICLQVFGYADGRARELAEHCGIAFQLTNILRDVKEDAGMGRIYLPEEDLEKFHYPAEDLRRGVVNEGFRQLMAFETDRARKYYAESRDLLPLIDADSRPALWAMMEIYRRLLEKIERCPFDVFGATIRLSRPEKTAVALRALAMRFF